MIQYIKGWLQHDYPNKVAALSIRDIGHYIINYVVTRLTIIVKSEIVTFVFLHIIIIKMEVVPVKFQRDWESWNPNLAGFRLHEIVRQDVLLLSEERPCIHPEVVDKTDIHVDIIYKYISDYKFVI